jgi:hypothetical protein
MPANFGTIKVERSPDERAAVAERVRQHRISTARVRDSLDKVGERTSKASKSAEFRPSPR